jgi:hypothetical protein
MLLLEEKEMSVASACVPCAIGHFSTSARLLDEAVRFKKDGLTSPQVLDDIAAVLGEQNALERIDLTPDKILTLPEWEREMADLALERSRELRHKLENIQSMEELESLAANTEEFYKKLNREWLSKRLEDCPTCKINIQQELAEPQKQAGSLDDYVKRTSEKRRQYMEELKTEIGS